MNKSDIYPYLAAIILAILSVMQFLYTMYKDHLQRKKDKKDKESKDKPCSKEHTELMGKMDEMQNSINEIKDQNNKIAIESIKRYLVTELTELNNGITKTEEQKKLIAENYKYYREHDGNSYIKHLYEDLVKKEKIWPVDIK